MDLITKHKKESVELLMKELNGDISMPSIAKYLESKSRIEHPGKCGVDTIINKEALRLASVYIQDYIYLLGGMFDES